MTKKEMGSKSEGLASSFLSRVAWSPVRYSDNVGVQFLLELGNIAKNEGMSAEEAINSFLEKMSASEDLYRTPFSRLEELALQNVGKRCNLGQQLRDSQLTGNIKNTVLSRRGLIGGLGGVVAGTMLGNVADGMNPVKDPEVINAGARMRNLDREMQNILRREHDLRAVLEKPAADRTPQERMAAKALEADKAAYEKRRSVAIASTENAAEKYSWLEPLATNMDIIMPVVTGGLGVYFATAGEGQAQARLKFEAFVTQMDAIINYRLGRNPVATDLGGR